MNIKKNVPLKVLAFLLAVVSFAAAAVMCWYQLLNFEILWGGSSAASGYEVRYLQQRDYADIRNLVNLRHMEELDLYHEQRLDELENRLRKTSSNLRWQVLDTDGTLRYGNIAGELPTDAYDLRWMDIQIEEGYPSQITYDYWQNWAEGAKWADGAPAQVRDESWNERLITAVSRYTNGSGEELDPDAVYLDLGGRTEILLVETPDGVQFFAPSIHAVLQTNQFGFRYDPDGRAWYRADSHQYMDLVMWLDEDLPVDDDYRAAVQTLERWQGDRVLLLTLTLVCAVVGVLLTLWLCVAAGHRRGHEGIFLNRFHRIPGDVVLVLWAGLVILLVLALLEWAPWDYYYEFTLRWQMTWVGLLGMAAAILCIGGLVTLVARIKSRTLLSNTAVARLLAAIPVIWKAVAVGVVYILVSLILPPVAWVIVTVLLLAFVCLWAYQWKRIRQGTQEIIGGNTDYQIDTDGMLSDMKGHADELNNLNHAIAVAVDERMRSERFKAELITNVSHDLKTPLTSIISYVDLLKKENIDNPRAAEYIEVLERKSQRLKKLTEDLVEASKASTGSLTVIRERLDLKQLLDQALAEYTERLDEAGLAVVRTLPEQPVWVEADGRHLWRVIDNLLSNCAKYALAGTRVYVEVVRYSECAALSIKNVSRDELNVDANALMERFVRGDESRTTEGSGLGLSIAQSLTDLQQGRFDIAVDGDLFKATVTLPLAEEE